MGCFLACFGGRKDRKRRRSPRRTLPAAPTPTKESCHPLLPDASPVRITPEQLTPNLSPKKLTTEAEAAGSRPEIRENREQGNSSSSSRKKVTFDLNVKTYEEVIVDESPEHSSEEGDEVNGVAEEEEMPQGAEGKTSPKLGTFPSNHRYENCDTSDEDGSDEEEEDEYEDFDSEEEDDEDRFQENEEESYDSFFSLPIDKEPQSFQEVNSPKPKSISSPDRQQAVSTKITARDRSHYVHSVLNPVENLSQWKEVKVRAAPVKNHEKENINSESEKKLPFEPEPSSLRVKKHQNSTDSKPAHFVSTNQELPVDTSLSTWLVSSENSTQEGPQESYSCRSNSSRSREEHPILGALTVDDIKQSSATSSPRKSPSRNPDEIPILGAVGSYWSCKNQGSDSGSSGQFPSELKGIPNTTSKYKEDKIVNWYSTPFEVRLERALNQGAS